jgi:DNA topoisomerase-3
MKEGTTTPPLPLTESELISLMDKNKIGTDATIAQHITTILTREYAIKDANQRFLPTPLGTALVEGYNSMGYQLNKPELRREMEHECNLVASQQKTKDDIIGPILTKMKDCFQRAAAEAQKLDEAVAKRFPPVGQGNNMSVMKASFSACGVCQNKMALKRSTGGDNRHANKVLYCNTCQLGHSLPRGKPEPKTEQENGGGAPFNCPICSFQVIKIGRGDGYEGNGT